MTQHELLRTLRRTLLALAAFGALTLLAVGIAFSGDHKAWAQSAPTPTPLEIFIRTRTPTPILEVSATPTRTPQATAVLVRIEAPIKANVRAAPSLNAPIVATLGPGKSYVVRARYEKWLQIEHERGPDGLAWVFEDVVNVVRGDLVQVPTVEAGAVPTANLAVAGAQLTAEFLTRTPGAGLTATVLQASATGIFTRVAEQGGPSAPSEPLPTFTYPPPLAEATLPARAALVSGSGLPPIVPIIGLVALGFAGLFISALRRGR